MMPHIENVINAIEVAIEQAEEQPKSREISIVITNLQTARLWAKELDKEQE